MVSDRLGSIAFGFLTVGLFAVSAVVGSALAADGEQAVPEPASFKTDSYRTLVPRTLSGAKGVLSAEAAKRLMDAGSAVFLDVYPRAPKPSNLPASTVWREPPHRSIKGAIWLPNVGYGVLATATQAYFEESLTRLTAGDRARPIVFFCLRDCWMSWNAAKRAIGLDYTSVYWLPDGTDGWEESGFEVENLKPTL